MSLSPAPISHKREAQKLTQDAEVEMFEITLNPSGFLYLVNGPSFTWQGNLYEEHSAQISGVKRSSDESTPRPTFRFSNPAKVFSKAIAGGSLNRAQLVRRKVLRRDVDNNVNVSDAQVWLMTRVVELGDFVAVELRAPSDGPQFITPARMFIPPEFPFVTL